MSLSPTRSTQPLWGGSAPIASEGLDRIAALYAIEKMIRGKSADERRAVRQEKQTTRAGAQNLARTAARARLDEVSHCRIIRYGLNHWDGLVRLDDGQIELDTNIVERSIRPIVLNRKNALFAGHDQGAENWAAIASLAHLSRPANCIVSIRKPTSPTCSQSSSISGLHRASTNSCLGVGQHSVPPIASRRNDEGDSRSRSIQRKNQAIGTVGSENRLQRNGEANMLRA